MKPLPRHLLIVATAFAAGVLGYLRWGERPPAAGAARKVAPVAWVLPKEPGDDLADAEGTWATRTPWGAPPPPPAAVAEPPPPPPPVPVGVFRVRGGYEALFVQPGVSETRVRVGGKLPDGGRVTSIQGFRVRWIDGDGNRFQRELFSDPPQPMPVPSGPARR